METTQFTLKACRINSGYTIEKVAVLMEKSEKTIRNWESGKSIPDGIEIKKLSDIYCVPEKLIFLGKQSTLRGHYDAIKRKEVAFPIIFSANEL